MFLFVIFHLLHFVSKHDDVAVSVFNVLLALQTVDGIGFLVTRKFDLNWWHPFDVLQSQLLSSFSFYFLCLLYYNSNSLTYGLFLYSKK